MQVESRVPHGAIKLLAIFLMLASAVAVPGWLYYKRGRKMPLRVVLEAERYVVRAGSSIAISARVLPADAELDASRWHGPGVATSDGASLKWRAPDKAGIYTLRFVARRGATYSEDKLSLRVLPQPPASYALATPPAPEPPPAITAICPKAEAARFELHGPPCRGGRVIAELKTKASWRVVWIESAGKISRGKFRALRLAPEAGAPLQVLATVVDSAARCVRRYQTQIAAQACVGGPRRSVLFADFRWELANPGLFRLAAKPPRAGQKRVAYRWQLEGEARESKKPHLIYRVRRRARHYLVSLEVVADGARASTIGLLTDRSFDEREAK